MTRSEKRREKRQMKILEILANGGSVASACAVVSIVRSTYYAWLSSCEWFDDEVMRIRGEVTLQCLTELQSQAFGRYVDECIERESARGLVVTRKHRWVNGKASALDRIIKNAEAAGWTFSGDRAVADGPEQGAAESVEQTGCGDGAVADGPEQGAAVAAAAESGEVSDFERKSGVAGGEGSEDASGSVGATVAAAAESGEVSDFERKSEVAGGECLEDASGSAGAAVAAAVESGEVSDCKLPADDLRAVSPAKAGSAERTAEVVGGVSDAVRELPDICCLSDEAGLAASASEALSEEEAGSAEAAAGVTSAKVSDCEGNLGSGISADDSADDSVGVSDGEGVVAASTLRNRRRNRRQKLAKALGKRR